MLLNLADLRKDYATSLIRFLILSYWSIYWLFNALDKVIGGSQFLWVGRDRFALFERFFASAGYASPALANAALILVAALEIFSFLFFSGALVYLLQQKPDASRSWFVVGIVLTLTIFTLFSIGDQVFGDHNELLELDTKPVQLGDFYSLRKIHFQPAHAREQAAGGALLPADCCRGCGGQ